MRGRLLEAWACFGSLNARWQAGAQILSPDTACGSGREAVVPVNFSSVPDLDVEMPRYKDAAPFPGGPVVQSAQPTTAK